jgi:hypothetical protein
MMTDIGIVIKFDDEDMYMDKADGIKYGFEERIISVDAYPFLICSLNIKSISPML